ncbi:MAG: hypothetical protein WC070_04915 [Candidatus Magasanikbacteria bacterium]
MSIHDAIKEGEHTQEFQPSVAEAKNETHQKIIELLENVPAVLNSEVATTKQLVFEMIERAKSVDLDAEDISAFEDAMKNIVKELEVLAQKVQIQLNAIQATNELVASGILSVEDVPEADPINLGVFQQSVRSVMSQVSGELSAIVNKNVQERYRRRARINFADTLNRSGLKSSHIELFTIPPLEPSDVLQKQRVAFENAKNSASLSQDVLTRAENNLRALEQKEQIAWDASHAGNSEEIALLDSIRTALDTGTLDKLFAKKGFDTEKAVKLIATQIREKAFSLDGIGNDILKELPEEVIKAIVQDMSDEEMWKTIREMSMIVAGKKTISYIYISKPYQERSKKLIRTQADAIKVFDDFSIYNNTLGRLVDALKEKSVDKNNIRDKAVMELKDVAIAIKVMKDSNDPNLTYVNLFPDVQDDFDKFIEQIETSPNLQPSDIFQFVTKIKETLFHPINRIKETSYISSSAVDGATSLYQDQLRQSEAKNSREREIKGVISGVLSELLSYKVDDYIREKFDLNKLEGHLSSISASVHDYICAVKLCELQEQAYREFRSKPFLGQNRKIELTDAQKDAITAIAQLEGQEDPGVGGIKFVDYNKERNKMSVKRGIMEEKRMIVINQVSRFSTPNLAVISNLMPTREQVVSSVLEKLKRIEEKKLGGSFYVDESLLKIEAETFVPDIKELQRSIAKKILATAKKYMDLLDKAIVSYDTKNIEGMQIELSNMETVNEKVDSSYKEVVTSGGGGRVLGVLQSVKKDLQEMLDGFSKYE